jgi:TolC family type I secretion outer membrane protein
MKRITLVLFLCSYILTGMPLYSQEKQTLTLEESLKLALEQNPFHLAAGKKVDSAETQVRQAAAQFFPSLNAQGTKNLAEKVMELEFPSMIPGEPPQRVEVDFTRDYQMTLSLNIPVFTGGRLVSGFKQANYQVKSSQEGLRQSRHNIIFNTKQAFYGILLAREFIDVAQEAVDVAEKLHENIEVQYEVGLASKFDLLRSEVQVANLKPQLIRAQNNLEVAKLSLKNVLGMDQSNPIEVEGELMYEPVEPDLEKCLKTALEKRPELKQFRLQKKMAGESVNMAMASGLPSVSISGQYNYWADQLNFKSDTWQNFYSLNLLVNIPIFNGLATHAKVAQAKTALKELEFNQKGLVDQIRLEVRQAVLYLEEARQTLMSQEKNVDQAQESLRIAELNFKEGLVTVLDVQQAQTALAQAKTNYSQALYDYVVAKAELNRAMGVD